MNGPFRDRCAERDPSFTASLCGETLKRSAYSSGTLDSTSAPWALYVAWLDDVRYDRRLRPCTPPLQDEIALRLLTLNLLSLSRAL